MSKLPKGWATTTIGELVTLNYGKSLPASERKEGPYCVYGSNGSVGTHIEAITDAPAIIIGRKGSIGEIHYSEKPCFPIDTTYFVDDFRGNDPRFFAYLFRQLPLNEMNRATAIPGLNREDAYSLGVWLPPVVEQKRIVEKVENLMIRTIRTRSDLDRIPALINKYKEKTLQVAFEQVKGKETSIGELAEFVTSGSRGWAKYYSKEGPLFLRVGNTKRGSIDLDLADKQFVTPPNGSEGTRTQVKAGDILVTITADLGRIAIVPDNFGEAYVNQHIALIRLHSPSLARYIAWFLVSPLGQAQLHEHNRGATRAGLRLDDIRNLRFKLSDTVRQEDLISRIETSFNLINSVTTDYSSAIKLLSNLDAVILSKAFQGKLVNQDPKDEPADILLADIHNKSSITTSKKLQPKSARDKMMIKDPKELLLQDSKNWPEEGLSFEEVAKRNSIPYDNLRDAIFSLLSEKKPLLRQVFDKDAKCLCLQRVKV